MKGHFGNKIKKINPIFPAPKSTLGKPKPVNNAVHRIFL